MIQEAMTSASRQAVGGVMARKLTMDTQKMKQARLELAKQRQAIEEQRLNFEKSKQRIKSRQFNQRMKLAGQEFDLRKKQESARKKEAKAKISIAAMREARLTAKQNKGA